jgi:hypothetical protein
MYLVRNDFHDPLVEPGRHVALPEIGSVDPRLFDSTGDFLDPFDRQAAVFSGLEQNIGAA